MWKAFGIQPVEMEFPECEKMLRIYSAVANWKAIPCS